MAKWILIGLFLVTLLYLNRAYTYFFDYLDAHQVIAGNLREKVEFRPANFPGKLTYVALGDSLTYGTGAKDLDETYPYLVAQHLIGPLKGDVDEYNLGIPGATTDDVIKFELNRVTSLSPQVITLLIGINDALSIKSESSFEKNYNLILDQITAEPHTKVLVVNIPSLTNSKNMLPPYKNLMDLRINRFNSIIGSLVKEKQKKYPDLIFVDLYGQTKDQFNKDSTFFSADYFHPSGKGYKLWSQILNHDLNL